MLLGVIADDFTGATDIASFLVQNGLPTVQLNGVPQDETQINAQAAVISLKSRSCPAEQAVEQSLQALVWLQKQGCRQFYFKYCSTFDSTARGNIGPVTDALLAALGENFTVVSPALPVNGRTVYQGHLFVGEQLLSESGMRHHPVTPMTDSNLLRLMESGRRTLWAGDGGGNGSRRRGSQREAAAIGAGRRALRGAGYAQRTASAYPGVKR